jgi:hypothetical protein
MEREIIERLAIDSAARELNEDTEILLQDYLSEHNETNKLFLEMQEIYKKTQAAFDVKTASIKKQFAIEPSLKFNWFPLLRAAAVIVISVCIGIIAGRLSKQDIPQQESKYIALNSNVSAKRTGLNLNDLGEGFWKKKIAAMVNPSPVREHREDNSVHSLLERYRQYLKEKKS